MHHDYYNRKLDGGHPQTIFMRGVDVVEANNGKGATAKKGKMSATDVVESHHHHSHHSKKKGGGMKGAVDRKGGKGVVGVKGGKGVVGRKGAGKGRAHKVSNTKTEELLELLTKADGDKASQ